MAKMLNDGLAEAAEIGDWAKVRELINAGADPRSNYGFAMNMAAGSGQTAVVEMLLRYNSRSKNSIIHRLCESSKLDFLKPISSAIIKAFGLISGNGSLPRADDEQALNVFMCQGEALYCAASGGHLEVFQLLFANGMTFETDRPRAMIIAIQQGHAPIVQFLLQAGTPLDAAFFHSVLCSQSEAILHDLVKILVVRSKEISMEITANALAAALRLGAHQEADTILRMLPGEMQIMALRHSLGQIILVRADLARAKEICGVLLIITTAMPHLGPVSHPWVEMTTGLLFHDGWEHRDMLEVGNAWRVVGKLRDDLKLPLRMPPNKLTDHMI